MDQLVQQVKHVISGSTESDTQSPDEWRELILQIFANVHKHKSVLELVFEMLNFLLMNNPELFVLCDPEGFDSVADEEQKCCRLTMGLCHHLLVLLSDSGAPVVNTNAPAFMSRLLVLLKSKNPGFFSKVASEFIFCLSDLVSIETDIYSSGIPSNPEISRFCYSNGRENRSPSLKLLLVQDLDICGRLQVTITRILLTVVPELCLYVPDVVQQVTVSTPAALWASLSYQLEYGNLELKTISLELTTKLLGISGLPEPIILDYFLDCVMSLVEACCTGEAAGHGDCTTLENALAENLVQLLSACQQYEVMEADAEQVYEDVAYGLCQCIISNGFSKLRTSQLKCALCDFLKDIWNLLAKGGYKNSILLHQIRQSVEFVVQNIGCLVNFEYVVGFIAAAVQHDIANGIRLTRNRQGGDAAVTGNQTGCENNKQMRTSLQKLAVEDLASSCIFKCVVNRLDELCEGLPSSEGEQRSTLLEGVWLILEILATARISLAEDEVLRRHNVKWHFLDHKEGELVGLWRKLLQRLAQEEGNNASQLYHQMVKATGALLQLIDFSGNDPNTQLFVVWMLSLPWLSGEVSWKDLKPPEGHEITELLARIGDHTYSSTQAICIQLLASLPKEVIPMWRTRVVQLALASMDEEVRCAAVKSFPVFVHQIGPSVHHLVSECIHPLLKDQSVHIQEALAKSTGSLACVMSRKSTLNSSLNILDGRKHAYDAVCIRCVICDKLHADHSEKNKKEPQNSLEIKIFLPFFEMATNQSTSMNSVKISLIEGVPSILSHVSFPGCNPQANNFVNLCLQMMKDEDYAVRTEFSKVAQHFVSILDGDGHGEVLQNFVSTVSKIVNFCHAPDRLHILETVLLTVGQVAKASEEDLLLSMLVILLDHICRKPSQLAWAVACSQIKQAAAHKKQEESHFVMQHGRTLLRVLVDHLHDAASGKLDRDPAAVVADVAAAFGFPDATGFLRRAEYMLLPHVVRKATPTASALLRLIGKQLNNGNHRTALNENMRHIFCHLVCSCEPPELRRTLVFLENEMNWKLGDILKAQSNINFELLLHLASDPNKVLMGLKILIARSESCQDVSNAMVVESLQPCLLGILVHFDNYLNNAANPLKDKQKAYRSLVPLMKLMGTEHITRVRVRLMTTLKIGLNFHDLGFAELCCTAWSCFVHMLDLTVVGSMLSQVVVNLLPLIRKAPRLAVPIVEYLVVENRNVLREHFHELYFLPERDELAHVNAILKGFCQPEDFVTRVRHLLKGVTHESLDVRQLALSKLKTLLRSNQASLQRLVLASETVDPIVSLIVTKLLQGCRESDQTMRVLYAECLGELGAIDPGRLDLAKSEPKRELAHFNATITEENFAFGLVNELAKAFLRADNRRTQDCVAFAIQELIRIFGITRSERNSQTAGGALWRRFKDEVQEILTPLFESKYTIKMAHDWSKQTKPVYHSKKCVSFEKWISTLTGYLASKVRSEKPLSVLEACHGVIRFVSQISLYLLPHVIIHVLLEGRPDDRDELVDEILAVLHDVNNPDTRHGSAADLRHMSAQTVFNILDHVTTWSRHRLMLVSRMTSQAKPRSGPVGPEAIANDSGYQYIRRFLDRIPQDLLAHASYNCGAFSRALMHFEQHLKATGWASGVVLPTQQSYDFLQQLYIALHEPDGVAGVTAIKQSPPTLGEQIKAYESMGRLSDASVCYDKAIQLEPDDVAYRRGLIRCRLALGELQSALSFTNGMIAERPAWIGQLNVYRVEAAWKLGRWDCLERYLAGEENARDWNVGLGRILLAAKNKNEAEVGEQLRLLRSEQMAPLSAACMELGSYQRGYEYIVRLHILNELETAASALFGFHLTADPTADARSECDGRPDRGALFEQWRNRLRLTQASYQTQEPILNVRRIMLSLAEREHGARVGGEIGRTWLEMARIARESGFIQTAHSSLLSASAHRLPEYCIENAKWFWARGEYDKAQACLEHAVEENYGDRLSWRADDDVDAERRLACAKTLLLLGRYCEETASCESNAIMRQYREVQQVDGSWEDGYFYIGKYYDKIMVQLIETEKPEKKGEFILKIVDSFGRSLLYGSQYIYQSMPRMLTLWLDYGSEVLEFGKRARNEVQLQGMRRIVQSLNRLMADFRAKLAPYQFLTAFPQLISRICHPDGDVFGELRDVIAKILVEFRQQAIWMMMAVSKSSYQMRVRRCAEIFARAKSIDAGGGGGGGLQKFLHDATKLTDRLLDLCNRNVEAGSYTLSVSQHFKPLQRLINDADFSPILLPLQAQMTPTLPSSSVSPNCHNCFSGSQVYITGIEDTVEVLPSLQRPKKITFQGSDGRPYVMLCKPKDDLRKDGRLMEFNGIINKCLRKDPESRRRDLHIRTYTVTPLNEECGLLEWVPNTSGLRNILMKLYKERGLYMSGKELKSLQLPRNAPLENKRRIYVEKLLPRHPAIFGEWFLKTFPDPTSWYNARLAYTRTVAVMSVVGYVLGLGDRHGENILFDSTSGDCVHVDFNCLFNKGETFDFPEIVPFRLTHNMVEAMGPTGHEGLFRRAAEVTLRVMRDEMDPLMSVLSTFIYDPLVEWSKPARGRQNAADTGETRNEKAQTHIVNIESRLKGVLKNKTKPRGLPLSVEGQVNHLIKEATDVNNLCQMYIGWAAYM